jgi:lysozyme
LREPCYLGIKGLLEFKNTLAFIKAGDWERAANGMLASKWAKQVGMRAIELSELMRKGK